ncbi:MAG: acyl-CoA thioesterase [bacterium]|nr:acyl-CoA thioesterase [bacterium]
MHTYIIRVRGFHLDLYGHVNNARYLEFLEEARWDLLEADRGLDWWHEQGLAFLVASITINYRRPAGLGVDLEIRSSMRRLGGRSAVLRQEVVNLATDEVVADADVTFVVICQETGRPVALDGALREAFGGDPA